MQRDGGGREGEWYTDLRRRAEEIVGHQANIDPPIASNDISKLVHDLHVSHIELELQNEELRRAYAELQAVRDRYADLYDFAPVAYLALDGRGLVREINLSGSVLLGLDRSQIVGALLVTFVAPEDRDLFRRLHQAVLGSEVTRSCEVQFIRSDGQRLQTRIEALALRGAFGTITGSRTIIHDITERKRAEDALFREKERAQTTLTSIGDAVITTTADGRIDFLNPIAETLTGWSAEEAIGEPLATVFNVVDDHTRTPVDNPVLRCLRQGRIVGLGSHSLLISRAGREVAIQDSAAPIRDKQRNVVGAVLVFQDVTEARRLSREVVHQAKHDPLTGLVNRREFESRLERSLRSAKLHDTRHALCYLDLDGFKSVNDSVGHTAGDELLRQIASLLSRQGRSRDTVARIGGDEFCLLMENCPLDEALKIAERVVASVYHYSFIWNDRALRVGTSIGLLEINSDSDSVRQILTEADVACYRAKDLGRNRVHVHQKYETIDNDNGVSLIQVKDLQKALDQNSFCLFCQPIQAIAPESQSTTLYEVLLRLIDERGLLVSPDAFIPIAERYGVMPAIDRWVIQKTFKKGAELLRKEPHLAFCINISAHTINEGTLFNFIASEMASAGFPSDRLCLEITETTAIHNFRHAAELIDALRQRGCRIALDDFGKGVSSMAYLKHLSVDYLKIDGSFVLNMVHNHVDRVMVSAMNQLAHALGVKTIAECVESLHLIEELAALKVDFVQGFAVGDLAPFINFGEIDTPFGVSATNS